MGLLALLNRWDTLVILINYTILCKCNCRGKVPVIELQWRWVSRQEIPSRPHFVEWHTLIKCQGPVHIVSFHVEKEVFSTSKFLNCSHHQHQRGRDHAFHEQLPAILKSDGQPHFRATRTTSGISVGELLF